MSILHRVRLQDLLELERRTGDGRVHLQLTFKRGLHPFFPSAVQVWACSAALPGAACAIPANACMRGCCEDSHGRLRPGMQSRH